MPTNRTIKRGDIAQIRPDCKTNPMFGGCMLVITKDKGWSVMGYVKSLGEDMQLGGQAYIFLKHEEFKPTGGSAVWVIGDDENE